MFLGNLGNRYTALDRPEQALQVIREKVSIYRELAEADPGRYRSDLAAAMDSLYPVYSTLNRPGDGLPAAEEAVAVCRELVETEPDRYRP